MTTDANSLRIRYFNPWKFAELISDLGKNFPEWTGEPSIFHLKIYVHKNETLQYEAITRSIVEFQSQFIHNFNLNENIQKIEFNQNVQITALSIIIRFFNKKPSNFDFPCIPRLVCIVLAL